MADDSELKERIARLAGRINRHKAVEPSAPTPFSYPQHQAPGRIALTFIEEARLKRKQVSGHGSYSWTPQRGTPYGTPRGRGWAARAARAAPHRHRSLILNNSGHGQGVQGESSLSAGKGSAGTTDASPGWITKHDRHMQLINNSIYEKKIQERNQAIEQTRKQKQRQREEVEKAKLTNHLHHLAATQNASSTNINSAPTAPQIFIHGIRYLITDGGSKLIKASDESNLLQTSPKRATIGGVAFLRSKHGNLYRAGFIKTKRLDFRGAADRLGAMCTNHYSNSRNDIKKIPQPCPQFSTTGTCPNGPHCRYIHDPNKVAICRDFLLSGKCQAGVDCDLSHDPTAERVPACLHFLRGNCTNPDCRYAHVRTNPGAPVCRAFATLGYCSKGAECPERHVHECPDYANKGICRNKKCRLPHVDRAGQLRKAAALQTSDSDGGASDDISSDDALAEYDSDDVDSDDFEEDFTVPDGQSPELSQQGDFVKF